MNSVERINLGEGLNLTLVNTDKFKTNVVSVYVQRVLDKDEVSKNALLPNVITSGSKNYPSSREISNKSDSLYGSSLYSDISKRGERQILMFKLITTNEKYLDEPIFEEAIDFLNEVINNPLVENGGFKKEYFELERNNLKDRIKGRINDKGRYALERCFEEMCKNERFSLYEYGYEEDLDNIDPVELYNHYKDILKSSPIDIVVAGEFDKDKIVNTIKNKFNFERKNIKEVPREEIGKNVSAVKNIVDKMDVTQGKLAMGYRTHIDFKDADNYYPLMVYSSILGGGPHSKLFLNVREKESLCYYVYSSIEKYKGIMYIASGVEFDKYDKTVSVIQEQLEKIQDGKVSDEEIRNSKNSMINSLRSVADSIGGLGDFYFAQSIGNSNETLETMIEKIEKVNIDDVVRVSKNIELDTVYFLRN